MGSSRKDRVMAATSCRDCDYIPKVDNTGKVYTEDGITFQIVHNGLKVLEGVYQGEFTTEIIEKLQGHHEPQEEKVFYEVLKSIPQNACMIEMGSYWAYYSMWFNHSVENATNFMIEPVVEKMKVGQENFRINNLEGSFYPGFIGEKSEEKSTFVDFRVERDVPKIAIDDFVETHSIPFIDLLHSDIQGAEYKMLLGCEKTIAADKIGYIFISTHGDKLHSQCIKFLKEHNFHLICTHTVDESYSGDGLIVGVSKNYTEAREIVEVSKRPFNLFDKINYKLGKLKRRLLYTPKENEVIENIKRKLPRHFQG